MELERKTPVQLCHTAAGDLAMKIVLLTVFLFGGLSSSGNVPLNEKVEREKMAEKSERLQAERATWPPEMEKLYSQLRGSGLGPNKEACKLIPEWQKWTEKNKKMNDAKRKLLLESERLDAEGEKLKAEARRLNNEFDSYYGRALATPACDWGFDGYYQEESKGKSSIR